jgi:uncharacterized protein (DUF608 family)
VNNRRWFIKKLGAGAGIAAMPAGLFAGVKYDSEQPKNVRKNSYLMVDRRNEGSHPFNGKYSGRYLDHIAFPIGGIGAGMFCIEGTGAISHLSVNNRPEMYNEPYAFAAICVKGLKNGAKVLEAPVPERKLFGPPGSGNGSGERSYGLPRFGNGNFLPRFPFATLELEDSDIPLQVKVVGWSPFIPGDEDNSSLPGGVLEYQFKNNSAKKIEAVFSYNARNFLDENGRILEEKNGFRLVKGNSREKSGFSIYVDQDDASVDYCWFRGGWFDPQTILWKQIQNGELVSNPPVEGSAPGASIFVPLSFQPGEEKIVKVNFNWYLPHSKLAAGAFSGPAFREKPSRGTGPDQMEVTGFDGKQLVNTFDPRGDAQTGILESPPIKINRRYLKFLVGGGSNPETTAVQLIVNGEVIETATGQQTERLVEKTWDLNAVKGKEALIRIVDQDVNPWGHVLADQFVLTDNQNEDISKPSADAVLVADFENDNYNGWKKIQENETEKTDPFYLPWYAERFASLDDLIVYWKTHIEELKKKSELFRDAFFNTTLPPEVVEAVAANLTILKSPTVLRQFDGRLWGWEGCSDEVGCCHGSCTHVWNYAQAIPHLFPKLERTLRETEFEVNQNEAGHQVFRSNLPITKTIHNFHSAADGQLGGIMKIYRDWRISGDTSWMKALYPKVKQSMDYCIETWDPKHQGFLEEPHHNTYDIEFWGPDGMCSSFYIGALSAFIEMSKTLNEPFEKYEKLMVSGKKYLETELFDGEYFIQKIKWVGLVAPDPVKAQSFNTQYSAEAQEILKKEGPKYQYGKGCLSDGILGMWMASVCGLNEVLDNDKVTSHLVAVHKYNLKDTLIDHDNPQRPTYACGDDGGLLLCTWPKGGKLSLPFVYSNEVWTGIEYQVASHLMFKGEVKKGLDIVRECRLRYDGFIRNPFNEYECGHWYARAMASYGMLEGLTGVRYDAVDRTLFIDSKVGDFTSFISTETGFGNVGLKNGQPFINCQYGKIEIQKVLVSGIEKRLS